MRTRPPIRPLAGALALLCAGLLPASAPAQDARGVLPRPASDFGLPVEAAPFAAAALPAQFTCGDLIAGAPSDGGPGVQVRDAEGHLAPQFAAAYVWCSTGMRGADAIVPATEGEIWSSIGADIGPLSVPDPGGPAGSAETGPPGIDALTIPLVYWPGL